MPLTFRRPTERDLQNGGSFSNFVLPLLTPDGPVRTTLSISGAPAQQASAQTVSDLLQGTLGVRDPNQLLSVVNKGLSSHLGQIYNQGLSGISTFSTAERSPLLEGISTVGGAGDPYGLGGAGGTLTPGADGKITPEQAAQGSYWAGWRGEDLVTAVAIMGRESGYNPRAFNGNRSTGDQSYGLFQINMIDSLGPARRQEYGIATNEELYDPMVNIRAAFKMEQGSSTPFYPWGPYKGMAPTYNTDVPAARAAVARAEQQGLFTEPPGALVPGGALALTGNDTADNQRIRAAALQWAIANVREGYTRYNNTNGRANLPQSADCSGLVVLAYRGVGFDDEMGWGGSVPSTHVMNDKFVGSNWSTAIKIPVAQARQPGVMQPGDLIFRINFTGGSGHVKFFQRWEGNQIRVFDASSPRSNPQVGSRLQGVSGCLDGYTYVARPTPLRR